MALTVSHLCNVIASVSLLDNAFYHTAVPCLP